MLRIEEVKHALRRRPRPSTVYVQSPGNWSVARFDTSVVDGTTSSVETCQFKWAFNVKPDLVIQTPSGKVLCIAAKWDSVEGIYPASETEKAIFQRRGIPYLSQTAVTAIPRQRPARVRWRLRLPWPAGDSIPAAGRCITWAEVITKLDRRPAPPSSTTGAPQSSPARRRPNLHGHVDEVCPRSPVPGADLCGYLRTVS